MSRYFARPRQMVRPTASWDDDVPMLPCLTADDHQAVETGLVDERGDPIWRAPFPIGFGRDGEW